MIGRVYSASYPSSADFEECCSTVSGRAFLANADAHGVVKVHARDTIASKSWSRHVQRALSEKGLPRTEIHRHRKSILDKPNSLEDLLETVGLSLDTGAELLYDPTGVFSHTLFLVAFARHLRELRQSCISAVLFHTNTRTIQVVLNPENYFIGERINVTALWAVESLIKQVATDLSEEEELSIISKIRVSFEYPNTPVVAIDRQSRKTARLNKRILAAWRQFLRASAVGAAFGLGATSVAAANDVIFTPVQEENREVFPEKGNSAVSEPNADISVVTGTNGGDLEGLVGGTITVPLRDFLGVRLDGAAGIAEDGSNFLGGAAAHLFWRDPEVGLIGAVVGVATAEPDLNNNDMDDDRRLTAGRAAAQGELYLNNDSVDVTLQAMAGYQFSDDVEDGFFGSVQVEYYVTDDFMLRLGAAVDPEIDGSIVGGFEFQPGIAALPDLAVFGTGMYANEDQFRALAGLRWYFGETKTLKERHRRDTFRQENFAMTFAGTVASTTAPEASSSYPEASTGAGTGATGYP